MKISPGVNFLMGFAAVISFAAESPAQPAPRSTTSSVTVSDVDSPARWDAALFLSPAILDTVLGRFVGSSITVDRLPNVRLTLRKVATKFDYGKGTVLLSFGAGFTDADIAQLDATGTLTFAGFSRGKDDDSPRAKFVVSLDSLTPSAKLAGKTLNAGDVAAQLTTVGIKGFLSEYLTFSVPVPLDLAGQVGFDDDLSFRAPAGQVLVHVTAPGARISRKLTGIKPIFVPAGLWLCADFRRATPDVRGAEGLSLAQRLQAYQQAAKGDARLLVRGSFLAGAINELRTLPLPQRTATIRGVDHQGNLVEGDATVWVKNDRTNGGHISFAPAAQWTPKGLTVSSDYAAAAHADIGFNFKLPIGNVGSSAGCKGTSKSDVPIQASFIPVLVSRPPEGPADFSAAALVLKPVFLKENKLQTLRAHVETDGSFKTRLPFGGWMKTDVPKVEIDVTLPVPSDVLPRLPLLTSEPHRMDFGKSLSVRRGVTLTPPKDGFATHAIIEPTNADASADGYWVDFKFTLATLSPADAIARKAAIQQILIEKARPKLEIGNIKVSVAGIGPNNDIIKALMVIGKAISDAYAEARKGERNIEATLSKANRDAERELTKAATNSKKEMKIAERNVGREVGKGAKNTEKALGKAGNDIANAASKAAEDFARETSRGADNVKHTLDKAVEDVKNFFRKPFG